MLLIIHYCCQLIDYTNSYTLYKPSKDLVNQVSLIDFHSFFYAIS